MRLLLRLLAVPVWAFGITVQPLPPCEFADTEVSTNLPFSVDFATMSRVEFTLDLDASPTNVVEVSIGTDSNGDSSLSTSETAWTFGYSYGRWFVRSADDNRQTDESVPVMGRLSRTFLLRRERLDSAWNLVKVVRRGVRAVGEVALVEGRKPGFALEVR